MVLHIASYFEKWSRRRKSIIFTKRFILDVWLNPDYGSLTTSCYEVVIHRMADSTCGSNLFAISIIFTEGSLHGVQLFPRESCSCSVNQRCSHIMAAMLVVGMTVTCEKKSSKTVKGSENVGNKTRKASQVRIWVSNARISEGYLQTCQTSMMEFFCELFSQKCFIIDVWQVSNYASYIR